MVKIIEPHNDDFPLSYEHPWETYQMVESVHRGVKLNDNTFYQRSIVHTILDIILYSLDTRSSAALMITNMTDDPTLTQFVAIVMTLVGFGYNRALRGRDDGRPGMVELWPFSDHDILLNTPNSSRK